MSGDEKESARVDARGKSERRRTATVEPAGVGIHGFVQSKGWTPSGGVSEPVVGMYCHQPGSMRQWAPSGVVCPLCCGPMDEAPCTREQRTARIAYVPAVERWFKSLLPINAVLHRCQSCDVRFVSLPEACS